MMNLFSKSLKISSNYLSNLDAVPRTVVTTDGQSQDIAGESTIKFLAQAKNAWMGFGASMIDFFESYKFKEIIFTLKTISLILCILALIAIIFIFLKMRALGASKKRTLKKWTKIERKFKSGAKSNYKLAILEADSLYDETLRSVGYDKEKTLSNLEDIKSAKKIKAGIIDSSAFVLSEEKAENALNTYKKGLEELGAL